ncbi:MAG: zf-HC2 domain-containing protein [Syntrophomonadaceae bacterium]|nr:zf-HC2 domain-containing protein [Syntrophomonadaceae bacterium]
MNCGEVSAKIYKYCDGEVSPQEHANISLHLDKCPVCRHMCQLTLMENDILREKEDIPELSPEFTSLVMNSLPSRVHTLKNSGCKFRNLKATLWLGSTVAAAAILLFLYLPQLNMIESLFLHSNKSSYQEQNSASTTLTQYDLSGLPDQVTAPDMPKSAAADTDTESQITESIKKPAAKTDNTNNQPMNQPMILSTAVPSVETNFGSIPNINRSSYADRIVADAAIDSSNIRPENIPERLNFVQVSKTDDNTIYNYASLDGKEYLQLTIKPYNETSSEVKTLTASPAQASFSISRDIQIADTKVTVIFTGNLSAEEMNKLADTVKFQEAQTN